MHTWQPAFGAIAGLITFLCFIPYIVTTIQGKTRPNRATWWIWLVLSIILTGIQYDAGAVNTLWLTACAIAGQAMIALLSLRYGEGGWNRFDRLCIAGSILSLLFWWQFHSALTALVFNIIIDFFAVLPTIKKSYSDPETENLLTWSLYLTATVLNLLAIEHWSLAIGIFPIYAFWINAIIVVLLLRIRLLRTRINGLRLAKKQSKRKSPNFCKREY